jgi:N-glycosylase/DNA lyase
MTIKRIKYSSIIDTEKPFDLINTLFSGQSFRWIFNPLNNGFHAGIIGNEILFLKQLSPDRIELRSTAEEISDLHMDAFLRNYFSLDIATDTLFPEPFRDNYPAVSALLDPYLSIRILRQNPFEILVSFMCAQAIGMPLIRRQVSMLSERYGRPVETETDHLPFRACTFPEPSVLAGACPDELARCTNNNRMRASNIIAAAKAVASGRLELDMLKTGDCTHETLQSTLCVNPGIGLKIADCVALFGLGRFGSFPIDTHVRQYLSAWFQIRDAGRALTPANYRRLQLRAQLLLGRELSGFAGHILFHCWRREIRRIDTF